MNGKPSKRKCDAHRILRTLLLIGMPDIPKPIMYFKQKIR